MLSEDWKVVSLPSRTPILPLVIRPKPVPLFQLALVLPRIIAFALGADSHVAQPSKVKVVCALISWDGP